MAFKFQGDWKVVKKNKIPMHYFLSQKETTWTISHHVSSRVTDITLYANDTVIYCSATNINDLKIKLNNDLHVITISKWCNENRLTLNISKCKFVLFGTQRKLKNIQEVKLQINNTTIESVESFKYLGIIIHQSLTWLDHIDVLSKKINQHIAVIVFLLAFLTEKHYNVLSSNFKQKSLRN